MKARPKGLRGKIDDFLAVCDETRRECAARLDNELDAIAAAAKVQLSPEFREHLIYAVSGCVIQHREQILKRPIEHRKALLEIRNSAKAAAKAISELSFALDHLDARIGLELAGKWGSDGLERLSSLPVEATRFEGLAWVADNFAGVVEDRGGAPKKEAFSVLIKGLAKAFEHARGREAKVAWNDADEIFEGDFLSLVEKVLPLVVDLAKRKAGQPLNYPGTPSARGRYIHRMTKSERPDPN